MPGLVLLLLAVLLQPRPAPAGDVIVTGRMHHLRSGALREWTAFPAQAEGATLVLGFAARANRTQRTLRLRHRDLKQSWRVQLNGLDVAHLPPDEADTITCWPLAPDSLRDGRNELRIHGSGAASDDVLIGEIAVIDRPTAELLAEASVDVAVHEAPGGRPIPSRITVTDERGARMPLGNVTDDAQAVRPGVVYSRSGVVRLHLAAGRYVVYAGRGFEYGVDRAAVNLAKGATATRRLTLRREVETAGWVSMDPHVHTATFARHGDATIGERMLTIAGEGLELPVSAEHNTRVDFDAAARAAGVRQFFTPTLGTEVTTAALGHFNVFPVPPGITAIDHRAPDWARLRQSIAAAADRPVVVLNHGRDVHGGFRPLGPARHLGAAGEDLEGWQLPANAMEVVNSGAVMSDGLLLPRDWMGMLNRGLRLTPVGSSDSHDVTRYIVGQGRTYVRGDDRDPGAIDLPPVFDSVRRGAVMVSYGLLTEIDVNGQGPGELVRPRGELAVRIRVKGPGWTRASRVALYANGIEVRVEEIAGGTKPGVKWEATWRLPAPAHDAHLVALATGPGVAGPYWPTAKPYQPTSPDFTPYVLGMSGAVFVDADASGAFESALTYARRVMAGGSRGRGLTARLAVHDGAVATQAASLLRIEDPGGFENTVRALMREAPAHVAAGLQAYLDAWTASAEAQPAPR